jgi:hypothetical protein
MPTAVSVSPEVQYLECFPCDLYGAIAVITCSMMEHLYAAHMKSLTLALLHVEAEELRQNLAQWGAELPEHLTLTTHNMNTATPHTVTLHMQWECAKIVLELPL